MLDWFTESPLNCLYGVALGLGFAYSLLLLLFDSMDSVLDGLGDFGNLFDVDVDAADGGDVGISMLAVAAFVSAFGAFGLAARGILEAGIASSIIIASTGGFIFGGISQVFFLYVLSPTTNSLVTQLSLEGKIAEVTIPIPESGTGQITLIAQGSRLTYSARSHNHESINRGTEVRIEKIIGSVATVVPTEEFEL